MLSAAGPASGLLVCLFDDFLSVDDEHALLAGAAADDAALEVVDGAGSSGRGDGSVDGGGEIIAEVEGTGAAACGEGEVATVGTDGGDGGAVDKVETYASALALEHIAVEGSAGGAVDTGEETDGGGGSGSNEAAGLDGSEGIGLSRAFDNDGSLSGDGA